MSGDGTGARVSFHLDWIGLDLLLYSLSFDSLPPSIVLSPPSPLAQFSSPPPLSPPPPHRNFNIHEYQSVDLFHKYGIPTPRSKTVSTPAEAEAAAESLGGSDFVVKAQILAGGRGKGKFLSGLQGGGTYLHQLTGSQITRS